MPKYRVAIEATVSTVVEVEAENPEEAIDLAIEEGPSDLIDVHNNYMDVGEWDASESVEPPELVTE